MSPRKYALTQLGDGTGRRFYSRRDANCPVIAHVRRRTATTSVAVPCWLVNVSEEGCQIASDHFPDNLIEVHLAMPGLPSKVPAKVKHQGEFTLHLEFTSLLSTKVVDQIGRIKVVPKPQATPRPGAIS